MPDFAPVSGHKKTALASARRRDEGSEMLITGRDRVVTK
jgi:hypothetical protein